MRRARWKRKHVRRVGLRRRRPPAAGGGWLALPCRSQGRKRTALGESLGPGRFRDTPASLSAAAHASAENQPARSDAERAKREAGQMRSCTPTTSAPSATGRQLQKSQKSIACPKASPNRSRHRYADPRCARRATAPERVQAAFSFGPCTARFLFGKTEKKMGGASRWTSPLREQNPPWPPDGGPSHVTPARRSAPADNLWSRRSNPPGPPVPRNPAGESRPHSSGKTSA